MPAARVTTGQRFDFKNISPKKMAILTRNAVI
jgi:hypothetical protein